MTDTAAATALRPPSSSRFRIALKVVAALVALLLAGALYERYAVSRDAARFLPPGHFVKAPNGERHLVCAGAGTPTILFAPSGLSNSTSFRAARSELEKLSRVCSYDRAGIGWSDRAPRVMTAGMLADDLLAVQRAADAGPSIIVASSIGGLETELLARRHPERVAGLVFLDAANSEAVEKLVGAAHLGAVTAACPIATVAGRVGLIRLLDPWQLRGAATLEQQRSAALMYGARPWEMLCALVRGAEETRAEFGRVPQLAPHVPTAVLSAETRDGLLPPGLESLGIDPNAILPALRETHQHLAARSSHGTWRIVPGSDHLIASSQPQAVVDAVRDLLGYVRRTGVAGL